MTRQHMMELSRFKGLFDTKWSFFVFVSYMALFINQGLLVTATQNRDSGYSYNTVAAVLLTELLKLIASAMLFLKEHSWHLPALLSDSLKHKHVLLFYLLPSGLYCLYNNLSYVNLSAFDPTTYFLLLQLRVVVTGVLFQLVFKRRLTGLQWCSMLLLTFGCIIKQLDYSSTHSSNGVWYRGLFSGHLLLILVQVFCSCFAGVYNEYLLKDRAVDVNLWLQNVFMYLDSILCSVLVLFLSDHTARPAFDSTLLHPVVLVLIVNNASIGIVTSLFLRSLNSILKTFASSLELMFTAVLSWLLFGIAVRANTLLAIAVVSAALYLYSYQPVLNPGRLPTTRQYNDADAGRSGDLEEVLPLTTGKPVAVV